MNVSLTMDLEQWIHERVERGVYQSSSEIVQEALLLLREHDRLQQVRGEELRRRLAVGIEQFDRGEGRPFNSDVIAEIKCHGRQKLGVTGS